MISRNQDLFGTSFQEQKCVPSVHQKITCISQTIPGLHRGKRWSDSLILVSISFFLISIPVYSVLLSSHNPALIHILHTFFSWLLSSLWSSFWEAVHPDTLVLLLISLKLWYTPMEHLRLVVLMVQIAGNQGKSTAQWIRKHPSFFKKER